MNIKTMLKRNRFIYAINATIKAALMQKAQKRLSQRYSNLCKGIDYKPENIPRMVLARLAKRDLFPTPKEKLRIFWVGTNWEQDNSGFLQALERLGEVSHFINSTGKYGLESSGPYLDQETIERNGKCLLAQIDYVQNTQGKIDLLLGQMWARLLPVEVLIRIQHMGIVTVNISMDDRLPELWETHNGKLLGAAGLVDGIDLTLTTSPECCIRFIYHGCPALYWPLASDPDLFKPAMVKDIDVSFVGNNYGIRGEIVRRLQSSGINVQAYGSGWPNGPVGPLESANIFGRSKIILGIGTIGYSKNMFTLKLRDFDATMAGALYVTHRNPDLLRIFDEGSEIECYATANEAVEKITYYLERIDLAENIGRAAAVKARKYHTWETRIASALAAIGLK